MILILPSAALTVRFLTRRFIGEYGDMGECWARAGPAKRPLGTGRSESEPDPHPAAGFGSFPSSPVLP